MNARIPMGAGAAHAHAMPTATTADASAVEMLVQLIGQPRPCFFHGPHEAVSSTI